jgi:hypothetical protein
MPQYNTAQGCRESSVAGLQRKGVVPSGTTVFAAGLIVLVPLWDSQAQSDRPYVMQTAPYPVYASPEPSNYNLKWGKMVARFDAGIQMEFNDNINLSHTSPVADIGIGPNFGVGFIYPLSRENILQLDLSAGYRWYLNSPAINTTTVSPRSRIDYRVFIKELQLDFHDNFAVQADPITRFEISGQGADLMRFQRINNTCGVLGDWRPFRQWGFMAGYDYTIDRTLNSEFLEYDYDSHTFSLGAYHVNSSRLTVGLNSTYSLTFFRDNFVDGIYQHDTYSYSAGPFVSWQMTQFISLDTFLGYTHNDYLSASFDDQADQSGFSGATFSVGLRHRMNSRTSQSLRFGHSVGIGYRGNYSESWSGQYNISTRVSRSVSLNGMFSVEQSKTSGQLGDKGNRYMFYLGTGFRLTRKWDLGVGYSFAWKDSEVVNRSYQQNRLTLDLRYQF